MCRHNQTPLACLIEDTEVVAEKVDWGPRAEANESYGRAVSLPGRADGPAPKAAVFLPSGSLLRGRGSHRAGGVPACDLQLGL